MIPPALDLRNVTIAYRQRSALREISLAIRKDAILAIVGPSGCGKSSLLMAINRLTDLIPGCSVSGAVLFAGQDIYDRAVNVQTLRRKIGMIFQKPNPFPTSIRRNLELPLRDHGLPHTADVIERRLRDVGLWEEVYERLDASALSLSGGQQQRLCIARALSLEPEVLLFDEPCSALDPISGGKVESLISSLRGTCTVVIVTHNLAQARRLADEVAFFWNEREAGVLLESGPAEQILSTPKHPLTQAYIKGERG